MIYRFCGGSKAMRPGVPFALNARMKNEPQSYGSQAEWVTGKTGQAVNQSPETHAEEVEAIAAQPGESDPPGHADPIAESEQPVTKVTSVPEGAKRGGFFKDRDYDS